jgi:predicted nucleotidyltransferase
MKIENKIREIVEKVLAQNGFTLHSIILFGSRARGDFNKESDFDVLVIVKEEISIKEKRELRIKISVALHNEIQFVPFDIIVKSLRDYEQEKEIVNTISKVASLEGIEL